jgi:hypothetical protein
MPVLVDSWLYRPYMELRKNHSYHDSRGNVNEKNLEMIGKSVKCDFGKEVK